MTSCANCGFDLPDPAWASAAFCPNCGQRKAETRPPQSPRPEAAADQFSGLATVLLPDMDAAVPGELTLGQEFHGRYVIDRRLGAGAMGVVYAANDKIAKRQVAIKLIHPNLLNQASAKERFIQEGLITRDIRHRNIIAMYDVSEAHGHVYLVMEFLPGETLRKYLARKLGAHEDVTVEAAVSLIRNMLEGLAAAHEAHVVHRDLKPENVMLRGNPDKGEYGLTILDFGIAQAIGVNAERHLTSSGATGTPLYMAPEQKTAADSVGPAADFYAITVMFYELVVGVVPSGRAASRERPGLPPAIDTIIDKGLHARPSRRYQTAREYIADLDRLSSGLEPPAPPPVHIPTPPRPPVPAPVPPNHGMVPVPAMPFIPPMPSTSDSPDAAVAAIRQRLDRCGFSCSSPFASHGRTFPLAGTKSDTLWEHMFFCCPMPSIDQNTMAALAEQCGVIATETLKSRFNMLSAMMGKASIGCVPIVIVDDPSGSMAASAIHAGPLHKMSGSMVSTYVMPVVYDMRTGRYAMSPGNPVIGLFMWPFLRGKVNEVLG